MLSKITALSVLILFLISSFSFSHPGRTDASGGHNDRKNGGYHNHNSGSSASSSRAKDDLAQAASGSNNYNDYRSSSTPSTMAASVRSQKINQYFRSANENVGALSCGIVIHERNLDSSTKWMVRNRDGNCCVICASSVKLEVDHMRGLQNGGSNDPPNLATLCDDCHTEKTRMDSSLRRKRDKICKS